MQRFFLFFVAALLAVSVSGCGSALQNATRYKVNREGTVQVMRIDDDSIALMTELEDGSFTFMLLGRRERGVRYHVDVDYGERRCSGTGFFYDLDSAGDANFDLRWNNRVLYLTPQMRPFLDRWNEIIAECR